MPKPYTPLVSVVIPTYNRGSLLKRAIVSVLAQTYQSIEIIVSDDGSTDNTAECIAEMAVPMLRYHRSAVNAGASTARNLGISQARGDLIAFLDVDDEWLPGKTERQVACFANATRRLGAVYCGIREVSPDWPPIDRLPQHRGYLYQKLRVVNVLRTSGVMVRRQVFDEVGGFDSRLTTRHDWDLWLRVAQRYNFGYIPDIGVLYHYGNADQLSYRSRKVFLANAVIYKRYNSVDWSRRAHGAHLALQSRELLTLDRHRLAASYALRAIMLLPSHPVSRWVLKQLLKHRLGAFRNR